MAELLFITPAEMTATTIMGGNVDTDQYTYCILDVQLKVIEELLGTELYDKIVTDLEGAGLSGLYLTMFDNYIKPITKYEACADYISVAPYTLGNAGLFKNAPEGKEIVEEKEVERLSLRYHSRAQMYVGRFLKWINLNATNIPEYKTNQDEVNASKTQRLNTGWYFGKNTDVDNGL